MSKVVYPPESVYNLIPKEEVHSEKPQRYMSKYRPAVVLEKTSVKDAMRTMGPAKVEVPSPEKYLKKHSKEPKFPEKTQFSNEGRSTCTVKKPAVPARTDNPLMGIQTKRDFIKTATVVPMKPQPTLHYGEVPVYLQQRNEEEQRAQEEYNNYVKEQREQGAMSHLSDEDRLAVLEGLKKNWDELHHEYQGLSLVTDNLSKKSQKQRLEVAMKQLENDINLFERFKTIYIPNN
ncbi:hypothetical protein FQN60_013523 [Etheostoma spectabile]|uniref:Enkurin domain-containing protein n=1 Tax=Etheostoma spectabile TaxID=54343 RepID=A0A5J5CHU9_9PERO|nr:hypothetical protein FQN60_013523 [Etheostoma spectabile]